ncbi:hypothetical protein ABW19_dt0200488 [Dactylella cylindrospora]|nr:hypothetical protein ABW19_dt0200488 [Dactylella cylindrospora]
MRASPRDRGLQFLPFLVGCILLIQTTPIAHVDAFAIPHGAEHRKTDILGWKSWKVGEIWKRDWKEPGESTCLPKRGFRVPATLHRRESVEVEKESIKSAYPNKNDDESDEITESRTKQRDSRRSEQQCRRLIREIGDENDGNERRENSDGTAPKNQTPVEEGFKSYERMGESTRVEEPGSQAPSYDLGAPTLSADRKAKRNPEELPVGAIRIKDVTETPKNHPIKSDLAGRTGYSPLALPSYMEIIATRVHRDRHRKYRFSMSRKEKHVVVTEVDDPSSDTDAEEWENEIVSTLGDTIIRVWDAQNKRDPGRIAAITFSTLSKNAMTMVSKLTQLREFAPGDIMAFEGADPFDGFFTDKAFNQMFVAGIKKKRSKLVTGLEIREAETVRFLSTQWAEAIHWPEIPLIEIGQYQPGEKWFILAHIGRKEMQDYELAELRLQYDSNLFKPTLYASSSPTELIQLDPFIEYHVDAVEDAPSEFQILSSKVQLDQVLGNKDLLDKIFADKFLFDKLLHYKGLPSRQPKDINTILFDTWIFDNTVSNEGLPDKVSPDEARMHMHYFLAIGAAQYVQMFIPWLSYASRRIETLPDEASLGRIRAYTFTIQVEDALSPALFRPPRLGLIHTNPAHQLFTLSLANSKRLSVVDVATRYNRFNYVVERQKDKTRSRPTHSRFSLKQFRFEGNRFEFFMSKAINHLSITRVSRVLRETKLLDVDYKDLLANAMYIAWGEYTEGREAKVLLGVESMQFRNQDPGIQLVSILDYRMKSQQMLELIRSDFYKLFPDGFASIDSPTTTAFLTDGMQKEVAELWMRLLSIPEVGAVERVYLSYYKTINQAKEPMRRIQRMNIWWPKKSGAGEVTMPEILLKLLSTGTTTAVDTEYKMGDTADISQDDMRLVLQIGEYNLLFQKTRCEIPTGVGPQSAQQLDPDNYKTLEAESSTKSEPQEELKRIVTEPSEGLNAKDYTTTRIQDSGEDLKTQTFKDPRTFTFKVSRTQKVIILEDWPHKEVLYIPAQAGELTKLYKKIYDDHFQESADGEFTFIIQRISKRTENILRYAMASYPEGKRRKENNKDDEGEAGKADNVDEDYLHFELYFGPTSGKAEAAKWIIFLGTPEIAAVSMMLSQTAPRKEIRSIEVHQRSGDPLIILLHLHPVPPPVKETQSSNSKDDSKDGEKDGDKGDSKGGDKVDDDFPVNSDFELPTDFDFDTEI